MSNPPVPPSHVRALNILRDLPAVASLVELCFAGTLDDEGRRYLQQMRLSGRDSSFLRWAAHAAETVSMPLNGFVWEQDGEIIGNASLIPYRYNKQKYFLIANVAVHPQHQRGGIGRALTIACMQQARQKNAWQTWLHVRDDNPGAIHLYESLGFQARLRRSAWRLPFDRIAHPEPAPLAITRLRGGDWPQQQAFLRRLNPESMAWYQATPWLSLRPGFFPAVERFLFGDMTRHWAVHDNKNLLAALSCQPMPSAHPARLWAALPPSGAEETLYSLLLRARRDLASWRCSLALDLPAGAYADSVQAAGFSLQRTLIWMQADETPAKN